MRLYQGDLFYQTHTFFDVVAVVFLVLVVVGGGGGVGGGGEGERENSKLENFILQGLWFRFSQKLVKSLLSYCSLGSVKKLTTSPC